MPADDRRVPDSVKLTTDLLPKEVRQHGDWPAIRPLVIKAMMLLDAVRATLDPNDPMCLGWEYDENTIMVGFTWDHGGAGFLIEEVGPDFVKSVVADKNPMKLNGFIGHHWYERRSRAYCDMRADGYGPNDVDPDWSCPTTQLLFTVLERQSFRSTFSIKRPEGWGLIEDGGEQNQPIWQDPRGQGWGLTGDTGAEDA